MSDSKISPSHYQLPGGFQVIDLTKHLGFCEGNVVKYVARAGNKGGESRLDDLRKAKYYLDLAVRDEEAKTVTKAIDITEPTGLGFCWGKH